MSADPVFESISQALQRVDAGITTSESHGALCGLLCARRKLDMPMWLHHTLVGCNPESIDLPEIKRQLTELAETAVRQLNDADFSFHPLLPDDDYSLLIRTRAVSQWCQGFLEGLRLGGVTQSSQLPGDAVEVVSDLGEIAKAGRYDVADSNENEADFAELVEYLRAGVRLVYEELHNPAFEQHDATRVH